MAGRMGDKLKIGEEVLCQKSCSRIWRVLDTGRLATVFLAGALVLPIGYRTETPEQMTYADKALYVAQGSGTGFPNS